MLPKLAQALLPVQEAPTKGEAPEGETGPRRGMEVLGVSPGAVRLARGGAPASLLSRQVGFADGYGAVLLSLGI